MSPLTCARRVVSAVLVAVVLAGCGGQAHSSGATHSPSASPPVSPSPSASRLDGCAPADAEILRIPEKNLPALPVAQLGSGPRAVVLANESDIDLCGWLPFARRLVKAGYRALLFDYQSPASDIVALVRYLRAHGAHSVALVGASQGAKLSIVVGSHHGVRVDALVSLSAESSLSAVGSVLPYARRLKVPVLFVTAAQDPYGSTDATRSFAHATRARHHRLIVVPGDAHGVQLLRTAKVSTAVLDWVHTYAH